VLEGYYELILLFLNFSEFGFDIMIMVLSANNIGMHDFLTAKRKSFI
jgi:hypothetical protein